MTGPLATLRSLARPLVALGIVLMLMATVVPAAVRADGALCIGAGETDGGALPLCDACVPVALPSPAAPALPGRDAARPVGDAAVAAGRVSRSPEAERIRDPPAL